MIDAYIIEETKSAHADAHHSRSRLYYPAPQSQSLRLKGLDGVFYQDGHFAFDRRIYTEDHAALALKHAAGTSLQVSFSGLGVEASVTPQDLVEINRHASETLTADDVRVFERYSANDALMRSSLKFTEGALFKFAQDFIQGRGVHLDHDSAQGFGRTFAAKVEKATVRNLEATWLIVRLYVVTKNATPERLQLIQDVASGVLSFDSPTFLGGEWVFHEIEGPDGENVFFFEVDDNPNTTPRLEAVELSLLSVLGNQYGTGSGDGLRVEVDVPNLFPQKTSPEDLTWLM